VIIPDINLLIYAYDAGSPFHRKAAAWWAECVSGPEPVGLAPVVIFGFVRIVTSGRVFQDPMRPDEAAGHVRAWLAEPSVQVLAGGPNHVEQTLKALEQVGTAGNLVTDAQIAAVAIEQGGVVHTADADFARFQGLRWLNPITGARSAGGRDR